MASSRMHPVKALVQHHCIDPLDTLTNRVADGVSRNFEVILTQVSESMRQGLNNLVQSGNLTLLIKAKLKEALEQALTADDAAGRSLRMDLIVMLANVGRETVIAEAANDQGQVRQVKAVDASLAGDPLLSTVQAAKILGFSRTYIAMLIDDGQFPGAIVSDGGHRRVPQSAVLEYQALKEAGKQESSTDYREAGKAAGMYEVPERAFIKASRRVDSEPFRNRLSKAASCK